MEDRGRKIFFSYARTDSKFVLRLASDLRSAGLDLWIDQLDIPSGAHWDQTVEGALKKCPGFLVVLSPASVASQNVMDEVSFAIKRSKKILPVLYRECEIPLRLERLQFVDFTGDYREALARLLTTADAVAPSDAKPSLLAEPTFLQRIARLRRIVRKKPMIPMLGAAALAGLMVGLVAAWERNPPSTCATRPGYPVGHWSTEVQQQTRADYSKYLNFDTSSSGIWDKGIFTTEPKVTPGQDIVLTYVMPNTDYRVSNRLRVSADGCTIKGQFDHDVVNGSVIYTYHGDKS